MSISLNKKDMLLKGLMLHPVFCRSDCLRSFTDLEELDETELYFCHKCKKRQKSTKKFWVQKLPKVGEQIFSVFLCFVYKQAISSGVIVSLFPLIPPAGVVSAPETLPLDGLFEKQGGHVRGVSSQRPGHAGLFTGGERERQREGEEGRGCLKAKAGSKPGQAAHLLLGYI